MYAILLSLQVKSCVSMVDTKKIKPLANKELQKCSIRILLRCMSVLLNNDCSIREDKMFCYDFHNLFPLSSVSASYFHVGHYHLQQYE